MENRKNVKATSKSSSKVNHNSYNGGKVYVVYINSVLLRSSFSEIAQIYSIVIDNQNKVIGFVDSIYEDYIEIILICDANHIKISSELLILEKKISVEYHDNILGSVIDPLGNLIFSFTAKDDFSPTRATEIITPAYNINDRKSLNKQFITGFNVIDFIYPIGYGQRMLLVGDKNTYKTSMILSMINNIIENRDIYDKNKKNVCIYVSIGQKKTDVSYVVDFLMQNKIGNVLVISADSSSPLGLQFLAPYTAFSVADFYAKNNYNICIFIDDLTKHANAYREVNLIAGRQPGRERFSSDIFYVHSSLFERALNYKDGGSITCIGVVETIEEDMSGYVPTNLISITDGQIALSNSLLKQDILPSISTQSSVSRTGSAVQIDMYKTLVSKCKKDLAIYYNVVDFYRMYKDDCDEVIIQQIKRGLFIIDLLYRVNEKSLGIIKQFICIVIISNNVGYDDFSIQEYEQGIYCGMICKVINNTCKVIFDNKDYNNMFLNSLDSVDLDLIYDLIMKEYSSIKHEYKK